MEARIEAGVKSGKENVRHKRHNFERGVKRRLCGEMGRTHGEYTSRAS